MKTIYKLTIAMMLMLFAFNSFSQTAGTMTLQLKIEKLLPKSPNWPYTPDYVFAVWITDNSNVFVKSLLVRANTRKQHLVAWNAASTGNTVDAVTGATYDSSASPGTWTRSHTATWNAKNVSNAVVTDGTYKVWIEQTSANSATAGTGDDGPTYSIAFSKSASAAHITPANQTAFTGMDLTWTPLANVAVTGVSVNPKTMSVVTAGTNSVAATVAPGNATVKTVTWTSVNPGVASVNSSGLVTGVSVGSTKVYAKTTDGNFTDTCTVTVVSSAIPVTKVTLNHQTLALKTGETSTLSATISPANATNLSVSWLTINSAVATLSGGVVTAVSPGTASFIVTTADGSFKDTCVVTVTASVDIQNTSDEQFSVFPNPVSSNLGLTFNAIAGNAKIDIYKPDGTKVLSKEYTVAEGKNTLQVALENLADGIYFISLKNGSKTLTKPFLIEK